MTEQTIKVRKSEVKDILRATFPDYRGRKFRIRFTERVWIHDLNASGGTINRYRALGVNGDMRTVPAPAPWANPYEGKDVTLTPDFVIVEHSMFCGSDLGITIYAHPNHTPKWLASDK